EHQGGREHSGGRVCDLLAGDVRGGAVDRFEHRGRGALTVDGGRGRHADASGDRTGQVGEDVSEQVVGDDHIKALRVVHHVDRGGVDVHVVPGDAGVLGCFSLHCAAPQVSGVGEHVVLVHQGEVAAAGLGAGEGVGNY